MTDHFRNRTLLLHSPRKIPGCKARWSYPNSTLILGCSKKPCLETWRAGTHETIKQLFKNNFAVRFNLSNAASAHAFIRWLLTRYIKGAAWVTSKAPDERRGRAACRPKISVCPKMPNWRDHWKSGRPICCDPHRHTNVAEERSNFIHAPWPLLSQRVLARAVRTALVTHGGVACVAASCLPVGPVSCPCRLTASRHVHGIRPCTWTW